MEYTPSVDYGPDVFARRREGRHRRARHGRSRSRPRPIATPPPTRSPPRRSPSSAAREVPGEFAGRETEVKEAVRSLTKKLVRKRIVDEGCASTVVVLATCVRCQREVGVLPTAHGTGLFQRGETQVMNVVTHGHAAHEPADRHARRRRPHKYFLFHYNMAPWANGETGRVGSPKRREIGHGALAARALLPVLPSQEDFATRCASSPRCWRRTARRRWRRSARVELVADGRRCADQARLSPASPWASSTPTASTRP